MGDLQVGLPVRGHYRTEIRRRRRSLQSVPVREGDKEVRAHGEKLGLGTVDGKSERGCDLNDGGQGILGQRGRASHDGGVVS
eukprot:3340319-Alexandrium_andersonii.AAC.1